MDTKLWLYPSLVLGTRQYAQASWEVLLLEFLQIEIRILYSQMELSQHEFSKYQLNFFIL
jgi:hypothetical protein